MESEHSYSGDSNSGSESSGSSSEAEDEALEPVHILGTNLELPQDLCEDFAIFKEFFSLRTWEALEEKHKQRLNALLPTFPEDDQKEKDKTIQMLFSRDEFQFTSPFNDFHNNLKQGNYRPDIAKMKKFLLKARVKQQRHRIKSYYAKLLPEILISRERLLAAARAAPPGPTPYIPPLPPKPSSKDNYKPPHLRARQRYFEELAAIRSEVGGENSEDENYTEGPTVVSRKRKHLSPGQCTDGNVTGTLGGIDPTRPTSIDCLKNVLAVHKARRHYKEHHPELNTTGITLEDIKQRVALVNGTKKLMFGSQKPVETPIQRLRRGTRKEVPQRPPKSEAKIHIKSFKKEHEHQNNLDSKPLLSNTKVKCEQDESDSGSSSFVDPVSSPKQVKKQHGTQDRFDVKQESSDLNTIGYSDKKLDNRIKQESHDSASIASMKTKQPVPIKLEDLDGIDMMALPVELADDNVNAETGADTASDDHMADADESLMETTHTNFLCLVRALFPARAAHRASRQQLYARCAALMRSPIAPLNTWYNLSDDWCAELDSALDFLAGEKGPHPDDFVPYLQFLPESQMFQWIGAGRDCDAILGRLCERWLRARAAPTDPPPLYQSPASGDPPPSRYPTSWIVRSATAIELAEFRAQERRRFASAAKPFTYVQYGYKSVVGPCARSPVACSAHGTLLVADRPRHATFMALVRDAIARLPNGEGTRQDIVTLLRMSQWIAPCGEQTLSSAVSSALERMHAVKRDPIVKYDQRIATWTYLHRHRSEEDWAKTTGRRNRATPTSTSGPTTVRDRPPSKEVRPVPIQSKEQKEIRTPMSPPAMELEVGSVEEVIENASDSDVDVQIDDSDPPSMSLSGLSSAQLLIQATQAKFNAQRLKAKQNVSQKTKPSPQVSVTTTQMPKPAVPTVVNKAPVVKQRQLVKSDGQQPQVLTTTVPHTQQMTTTIVTHNTAPTHQSQLKHASSVARRGVVRVLSPAAPSPGKSLISPRALLQQGNNIATKRRIPVQNTTSVTTVAQSTTSSATSVVSSVPALVTSSSTTRTVQLAGGRTVQLATTQTVHLPSGQAVQLAAGPSLQLSSAALQLPAQCVRLPSGQTVQIATPQTVQTLKTVSTTTVKTTSPRPQHPQTSVSKSIPQIQSTQLPNVSTVQLTGQTVQIGGQSVQIAGHTVKLPSGQNVQMSGQSVQLPSGQAVQLASGQTVQLASAQNLQTVQLAGQNVQIASAPNVQTVQLAGQTVQLGGQTVQLSNGQTIQLSTGQVVQAVQVANQSQMTKSAAQVVRTASAVEKPNQPIVAKLLTNAQGQMISLEGVVGGTRTLQLAGVRPQGHKTLQTVQGVSGVRVVSTAGARVTRPLLLTSAKPLHNIILQQLTIMYYSKAMEALSACRRLAERPPHSPNSSREHVRKHSIGSRTRDAHGWTTTEASWRTTCAGSNTKTCSSKLKIVTLRQ
ncbi:Nuclear factor related to kappa-B-binding protein [Eumeta japonica]|uniref:Nuclear factor related to kappa-B-binding protein n=1 Tax=Eumeta variegata TaxID=151549 RepID=A0A4C1T426_EUMVA|nr:Nuclear factor related to kappa-B-binding protein [Eumeta japonica]